ncbi:MAG TPA: helix-turn-helix transcriptional regulator [Fimbriimonadaceae bacterium]|nr:helix-turn-helix transcriptional regulator [Fimbriimonadaceae bacterium]
MRNELVRMRHRAKLSQREIAKRLGVSQPRVAEIESMDNDPRLSTLIDYARAVGAEIRVVQISEPHAEYPTDKAKPATKTNSKNMKRP